MKLSTSAHRCSHLKIYDGAHEEACALVQDHLKRIWDADVNHAKAVDIVDELRQFRETLKAEARPKTVTASILQSKLGEAMSDHKKALQALSAAATAAAEWFKANPPTSCRLQEADFRPDGSYSPLLKDELIREGLASPDMVHLIMSEGAWVRNPLDPIAANRTRCRRVVDVTWDS